jgi:outer membrane protein assembly factor BamE
MTDFSLPGARRAASFAGWLAVVCTLSACGSMQSVSSALPSIDRFVTPYRIDIIQGNFVSREQAAAVKPGMPRAQVRDILGTPLLASAFHSDRWDYVFTLARPGQPLQQRKLTAFFKDDLLERIESDELPSEAEFVASMSPRNVSAKVPTLQASEASLAEFAKRNAQTAATTPPPVPPISNYPPLEPVAPAATR